MGHERPHGHPDAIPRFLLGGRAAAAQGVGGRARARGDGEEYLAALREFDRRLRVYPQFGDPMVDLVAATGHVRLGAIPPLAMRYGVVEERRLVLVAAMPVLMLKRVVG